MPVVAAILRETGELDQLIRRGAPKDKLHAAFGDLDKALNGLTAAVNQNPAAKKVNPFTIQPGLVFYNCIAVCCVGLQIAPLYNQDASCSCFC